MDFQERDRRLRAEVWEHLQTLLKGVPSLDVPDVEFVQREVDRISRLLVPLANELLLPPAPAKELPVRVFDHRTFAEAAFPSEWIQVWAGRSPENVAAGLMGVGAQYRRREGQMWFVADSTVNSSGYKRGKLSDRLLAHLTIFVGHEYDHSIQELHPGFWEAMKVDPQFEEVREGEAEDAGFTLARGVAARGLFPPEAAERAIDLRRSELLRAVVPGTPENQRHGARGAGLVFVEQAKAAAASRGFPERNILAAAWRPDGARAAGETGEAWVDRVSRLPGLLPVGVRLAAKRREVLGWAAKQRSRRRR